MADIAFFDRDLSVTVPEFAAADLAVLTSRRVDDVAATWAMLEAAGGVQSPGQSLPIVRTWIDTQQIAESEQLYLVAEQAGTPLALLPLRRERRLGASAYTWFLGAHVGCNGPIADPRRLAALGEAGRAQLWNSLARAAREAGADLLHLPAMPAALAEHGDMFAGFGRAVEADTLYRAQFSSWEQADTTQRNKSRRKHDRQQGDKLAAMGDVAFQEIGPDLDATPVLERMFAQRAARFTRMGVSDPFASPRIRRFYAEALRNGAETGARLAVLRLNGEVVAVRYNIVRGSRVFCLISSMSTETDVQPGSPGKQILLRLMQTVFDAGYSTFDMGAGLTDEKRHWCNVQIALRDHVVPLTLKGRIAADVVATLSTLKTRIKSDERLLAAAKRVRGWMNRGQPEERVPRAAAED